VSLSPWTAIALLLMTVGFFVARRPRQARTVKRLPET
jgi:hypothetical protein